MSRAYLLFRSTHETMKAEAVLQSAGMVCKVVMKPAGIRLDCGLAVRIDESLQSGAVASLKQAGIDPRGIYVL